MRRIPAEKASENGGNGMKREQQEKNRCGFWQGRGFYMILALCLIAVGGLGVVTLTETFSRD